jgi:hypothetical protein
MPRRPEPNASNGDANQAAANGASSPTLAFKKRDIARAYKAIIDAGGRVSRIEVANGRIIVVIGEPDASGSKFAELDGWMAKRAREIKGP